MHLQSEGAEEIILKLPRELEVEWKGELREAIRQVLGSGALFIEEMGEEKSKDQNLLGDPGVRFNCKEDLGDSSKVGTTL
jgi:hypothetical protein